MSSDATERNAPYYCPYCGGEDLWPNEAVNPAERGASAWECRECTRVFTVTFVGLLNPGALTSSGVGFGTPNQSMRSE